MGTILVPNARGQGQKDVSPEQLRDLIRTLQGGSVLIMGRESLYPVRCAVNNDGDVGSGACQLGLNTLMTAISEELRSQMQCQPMQQRILQELALLVTIHISVGPGLQVAIERGLSPALWQPMFVVCIGCNQVRVLTFAFIGEPVVGDRPDCKRTPFALLLASQDLLHAATKAARGVPPPREEIVYYNACAVPANARTQLDVITFFEEKLSEANRSGNWCVLTGETSNQPPFKMPYSEAPNFLREDFQSTVRQAPMTTPLYTNHPLAYTQQVQSPSFYPVPMQAPMPTPHVVHRQQEYCMHRANPSYGMNGI